MASKARSLAKTITWRVVAIILTFLPLLIILDWHEATGMTAAIHTVKTIIYYMHERVWNRVKWGRDNG